MSTRTVTATITEPTGQPRAGLIAYFTAPVGYDDVTASADAAGTIRPELETGVEYRVSVENAVIVDGVAFPAGTVILVTVPEGEGPCPAIEALTGTIDASRPALLDMIAALTARVAALEPATPIAEAGQTAGGGLADLAGEVE